METLDFDTHIDTQLGIEVRQRFIEQKELRIAHQCAPHRNALTLSARQLTWFAVKQMADLEAYLKGEGIDYIKCSSTGRLSKYYSEGSPQQGHPMKVMRESSLSREHRTVKNIQEGEIVQGGSTLTQQLVRNLYIGREVSWERKTNEACLAIKLESEGLPTMWGVDPPGLTPAERGCLKSARK